MSKESPKLHGRVTKIGGTFGDNLTEVVITCDREELRQFPDNLHGMRVTIERFKESSEGRP